jgi:hypothetical protein
MYYYTVYKITNKLNNKYYIGVHKTKNINDRYFGSGKIIKEAIAKYNKINFIKEVLYVYTTKDEAYLKEKELVNKITLQDPLMYNIQEGGIPTADWVDNRRINHSKNISGENHHFYGKKLTETHRNNISAGVKGRKHSKETIEKIVATRKKNGIPNSRKGIPLSDEDKAKKSAAALLRKKIECPHCHKLADPGNAKRHHFDNCKLSIID